MSRPKGSEIIDDDRLRDALSEIRRHRGQPRYRPSRQNLAFTAFFSDGGIRSYHRRHGLTYAELLDRLDYPPVSRPLCPSCGCEPRLMRFLIDLDPAIVDQLRELARSDRRHPRDEVAVLVSEAVRRRQPPPVRITRPRPTDSAA